jgi:hypothetical protein
MYTYVVCYFALPSHFFMQKAKVFTYILQDFLFGIGIWFWAVENGLLECSKTDLVFNLLQ